MSVPARISLCVVVASLFVGSSVSASADSDVRLVDCANGASIQDALGKKNPDRPLTVVIRGVCTQNVTITRDDVTLVGDAGTVNGTISIIGARRVLIRDLTVSSPTGNGIFGTDNAAFRVERSKLERNNTNGIIVRNGAQATVRDSELSQNGHTTDLPDTGRGIEATHNGSIDVQNSTISGNRSDGVAVFNGSYARLVANTITGNGRLAAGEAGVQVSRGRIRANANVITNNTGSTAVLVVNHGDYRTGTALNAVDFPDNEFPSFEEISHPVGSGRFAIDINNNAYGDFRQVDITGSISVGAMSMMQVRGDEVGPNLRCSTVTVPPGGTIGVNSRGFLRFRYTQVTAPAIPPNTEFQNPQCPLAPLAP